MYRESLHNSFHHSITSPTFFQRLIFTNLDSYYYNRILRWAGQVARMPVTRALRQFGSCLLLG
jgi:hypothetical protein